MWLAFFPVLAIILSLAGLVFGVLPLLIPGLLLLAISLPLFFKGMRTKGDSTGRLDKGPAQEEGHGHPEDTPGGPAHASTGHAHGGQQHMTP